MRAMSAIASAASNRARWSGKADAECGDILAGARQQRRVFRPDSPPAVSAPEKLIDLDVAIVGAGPAGSAAALALGGRGLRVGIIEKAVPPRYKTCGGGVLRRAAALLPFDLRDAVEREC